MDLGTCLDSKRALLSCVLLRKLLPSAPGQLSCANSGREVLWGCSITSKGNHREFVAGLCSKDVKQASRLLLRTLYLLMQDLGPLPNDITLSMKLLYYNHVTPKDYQPPGFKEDGSTGDLLFAGDPINLKVGSVSTDFHLMKVRVTTEKRRVKRADSSLIQKNGPTEISYQGLDCEEDEEEEECTKNHPCSVRADSNEHEGDKSDTHPDKPPEPCFQPRRGNRTREEKEGQ